MMKIRLSKRPIRTDWSRHTSDRVLLLERDISIGSSRLKAKLLVFRNRLALRQFWEAALGNRLPLDTFGVVNGLQTRIVTFDGKGGETVLLECDPRYFCVIGLLRERLTMEVICHEAVHAAYCFADRRSRCYWHERAYGAQEMPEELVAYPAGKIASQINHTLDEAGLYPKSE